MRVDPLLPEQQLRPLIDNAPEAVPGGGIVVETRVPSARAGFRYRTPASVWTATRSLTYAVREAGGTTRIVSEPGCGPRLLTALRY